MTIPTATVSEQEWNARREALHDEYTPEQLAGGRTSPWPAAGLGRQRIGTDRFGLRARGMIPA